METSAPKEAIKAPIYTHGSYWGGPQLPYWVFLLFTVFPLTGFFGIDHLLFKSPSTAFTKGLINIVTLGLWYFYDILQAFNDREFIEKYGFSKPATGPAGLALDYFTGVSGKVQAGGGDGTDEKKNGFLSTILFMLYVLTLFVPFGISNFIAGDNTGGLMKFILSFVFPWSLFWFPYFFVGSFFEAYRAVLNPQALFEKGTLRIPPLNLVMASDGFAPNIMNPKALGEAAKKSSEDTFYNNWIKPVLSFIPFMDILDTTKCAVVPPVQKTIDAAQSAGKGVVGLAKTVPAIAQKSTETLTAFTDPEKLKALAKAQSGGGIGNTTGPYDWIILGGLGLLVVGGFGSGILRKYFSSKKNDEPSGKGISTDAPPNPGPV